MLEVSDYVNLGVAGVAILSSIVIVKAILKSQKEKDHLFLDFIKQQERNFNELVTNHLSDSSKAMRGLEGTIDRLHSWLKNNK